MEGTEMNGAQTNGAQLDEPIETIDIVLAAPGCGTLNRLQFQTPDAAKMNSCTVKFKKNVKHLHISVERQEAEQEEDYHDYFHDDEDLIKPPLQNANYEGEGFSHHGIVNNALGFIHDGRFYLVPIEDLYDMQHLMPDQKAEIVANKIDESKLNDTKPEVNVAPVRVKFGRAESDFKKKKREQSAQHKQKLIDQDPWIDMTVQRRKPYEVVNTQNEITVLGVTEAPINRNQSNSSNDIQEIKIEEEIKVT